MSFLKNHYEKIILTILLIFFVGSLVYLIIQILNSRTITPDMLRLPKKNPDYKKIDFENQTYNVLKNMASQQQWIVTAARNPEDKFWSDFMIPFRASRSPYGKKVIVPFYYFSKENGINKDPFTGQPLPPPMVIETVVPKDRDNDGISNDDEKELGLNPDEPTDALADMDGDGFSNIEEYKIDKLFVNDATKHPPLVKRLYVVNIVKSKIPIKLKKVRAVGQDKKDWEIHAEVYEKGRWRSKFPKYKDVLNIGGRNYTLTDIENKKDKIFDKTLNAWTEKDSSSIFLEDNNSKDIIKAEVGEPVFAPRMKVVLQDVLTEKKYQLSVGDSFTLGNEAQGLEKYKIATADPKKEEISVTTVPGDTIYTITREKMESPEELKKKREMMGEDPMSRLPFADPALNPNPKTRRSR